MPSSFTGAASLPYHDRYLLGDCALSEFPLTRDCLRYQEGGSRAFKFIDRRINGILHSSSSAERKPLLDPVIAFSPAIIVFVVTLIVSFYAGTAEDLFIVQSKIRTLVRFLAITVILLVPLPILPPLIAFVGKRLTDEGFLGRLVKDNMGRSPQFSKYLLWIIRPLQGVGMSMIFSNQLLNLFRTHPEVSFLGALIRPILFIVISLPISILFSTIWALDDLGVKLYLKKTGEVRLVGSYLGTILPAISGALGIYSLLQRNSPGDALLLVSLIVMVLYPPYVLLAVIHNKFLSERKAKLFENLLFDNIEVYARAR